MKKVAIVLTALLVAVILLKSKHTGFEEVKKPFTVKVGEIESGTAIDRKFAYCVDKDIKGANIRPAISWKHVPDGTKSFAIVVLDADVPTDFSNANQEEKTIPIDQKRQNFFHYVLVDIPADIISIGQGDGRGSKKSQAPVGKTGVNDYVTFLPNAKVKNHIGYDGMCPPWNDERIHNYQFIVFALKTKTLNLPENFKAREAYPLILKNKIASAKVVGTYTRNSETESK